MDRNTKRDIVRGAPELEAGKEYSELGIISAVFPDTYTCNVRTDTGKDLNSLPFPELVQDPVGGGGSVRVPRIGHRVRIAYGSYRPKITGFVPQSVDSAAGEERVSSLTEFESPGLPASRGRSSYRGAMPKGLLPGDWCCLGNQGQYIGVLDGGVSILHGSPWANVRAIGGDTGDTLKLTGRTMELMSDFGSLVFASQEGKSWMDFYGGTDQTLETGVDRQNWTVRGSIGKESALLSWSISDRDAQEMYRLFVYPDGRSDSYQAGPRAEQVDGDYYGLYDGNYIRQIQTGTDTVETLNGDRVESFAGNHITQVNQNRELNVFGDHFRVVEGDDFTSCRTLDVQAQGSLTATPGSDAVSMTAVNGSFSINVAPTVSPALPTPLSGFYVNVGLAGTEIKMETTNPATGNITLDSKARATFNSILPMTLDTKALMQMNALGPILMDTKVSAVVNSTGPVAINTPTTLLSAQNNVAINPAVLYNELIAYLQTLAIALDTHVHMVTVPGLPSSPPIPPTFSAALNASMLTFMSKKVFLGG